MAKERSAEQKQIQASSSGRRQAHLLATFLHKWSTSMNHLSNKRLHFLKVEVSTQGFTIDAHSNVELRVTFHSSTTKNSRTTRHLPQIYAPSMQTPVDPPMTSKTSSNLSKQSCRLKRDRKLQAECCQVGAVTDC